MVGVAGSRTAAGWRGWPGGRGWAAWLGEGRTGWGRGKGRAGGEQEGATRGHRVSRTDVGDEAVRVRLSGTALRPYVRGLGWDDMREREREGGWRADGESGGRQRDDASTRLAPRATCRIGSHRCVFAGPLSIVTTRHPSPSKRQPLKPSSTDPHPHTHTLKPWPLAQPALLRVRPSSFFLRLDDVVRARPTRSPLTAPLCSGRLPRSSPPSSIARPSFSPPASPPPAS